MLPQSGSVLGVDVGWSLKQRSSAICRLDWTDADIGWTVQHFTGQQEIRQQAVSNLAGSCLLQAAAFDGPLRGDLAIIDRYRLAERLLSCPEIASRISKPGSSRSPVSRLLNHHTNQLAQLVLDNAEVAPATHDHAIHQSAICEAFPSSFLGLMLADPIKGARQKRSDRYFEILAESGLLLHLLKEQLPGRAVLQDLGGITNHDDRAAFICALTALCVAAGDYSAVGDDDGWIIMPPLRFVAPWARPLVRAWNNPADEKFVTHLS
jgi:hypothetical protein